MIWLHVLPDVAVRLDEAPLAAPAAGFHWLDLTHEQLHADREALRDVVSCLSGVFIDDLHLRDAANLQHPSYFGSTAAYQMLIFRKLTPGEDRGLAPLADVDLLPEHPSRGRRLQPIVTRPVTFFIIDRLLVTVRNTGSRTIEQVRQRLLDWKARPGARSGAEAPAARLPQRPEDLTLRLVNGMVDRYLDLRQPLTERLDRWQRELLDRRRPFEDWSALLDARIELRRLQSLCEEQRDAIEELREEYLESLPEAQLSDAYLVRVADVIEHIERVLGHAGRLEDAVESAVQLHFSATAHRTNQIMRILTVITAVFAPLTLVAGLWGMNFEHIPGAGHPHGFVLMVISMAVLAAMLLVLVWIRRVLTDRPTGVSRWWRRRMRQRDAGRPISGP
ncbi:MAG: magnesium transporter CorA family protein [Burkholderiaceae bacterium]|jgi:Mg2+ and Co2+ transporter CorA|nr:magnesium transporter CorA family protein [Burkholderiaceae bacterium]